MQFLSQEERGGCGRSRHLRLTKGLKKERKVYFSYFKVRLATMFQLRPSCVFISFLEYAGLCLRHLTSFSKFLPHTIQWIIPHIDNSQKASKVRLNHISLCNSVSRMHGWTWKHRETLDDANLDTLRSTCLWVKPNPLQSETIQWLFWNLEVPN